jgi:acyl transferase domain-containing protein/acyl carrier protein
MDDAYPRPGDIAIVGMAGRFPGARNIDAFWSNLTAGKDSITFFSDSELKASGVEPRLIDDPRYVKATGVLDDIDLFDANFFGFTPKIAMVTDPQHRLFLENSWEALESAGYYGAGHQGRIGVFAGCFMSKYAFNVYSNAEILGSIGRLQARLATDKDFFTTLVSYKLGLKGPSIAVQTACSTSLVAVHLACQSLLSGDCDMALAGGVTVHLPQRTGYLYVEGGIESPDGRCRAFDAKAQGTVSGSGVAVVVLKLLDAALADHDHIHAVIRGSAVNNDGAAKVGYTAPSVDGQAAVISDAMAVADVDPGSISYIEAHGTGTPLGDSVEIAALSKAFGAGAAEERTCAIGSVKTNIGHLDAAAGAASLIKTVMALKHGVLPPSLHFEEPHPEMGFETSPFVVNATLRPWNVKQGPRRAGVSSFGMGGTNAHVIVEEPPPRQPMEATRPGALLVLSAKTASALEAVRINLVRHLEERPELSLADVAYTLQVGREPFKHRRFAVGSDLHQAMRALEEPDKAAAPAIARAGGQPSVAFMFPGIEFIHLNAGLELYRSEVTFRKHVDECAAMLQGVLGMDLRRLLYPDVSDDQATQRLRDPKVAPAALFVLEYALARLWQQWGVQPKAMIGHGVGEYVAACLSGVLKLEDALSCVVEIGRTVAQSAPGAMLAVHLSPGELEPLLGDRMSIAAVNGAFDCVVSGAADRIEALERDLVSKGCAIERLATSHAFNSPLMDPLLDALAMRLAKIAFGVPQIPYLSTITGRWITTAQINDPGYWARQLRDTVRFDAGLVELRKQSDLILLEVGPSQTLAHISRSNDGPSLSSLPGAQRDLSEFAFLLNSVGRLWQAGYDIDWSGFHAGGQPHRIPLPTYPFERSRHWVDALASEPKAVVKAEREVIDSPKITAMTETDRIAFFQGETLRIWSDVLGVENLTAHDDFFELGGNSLIAMELLAKLRNQFQIDFPLNILFEAPTVAEFATLAATQDGPGSDDLNVLEQLLSEIEVGSEQRIDGVQ